MIMPTSNLLESAYWGRAAMDPERGQCQRTDGKEWRCSRDVLVGQKYCERHVNRGRNRSRKPVGIPKAYIPGGSDDGGVHKPNTPIAAQPLTMVVGENHFDLSGPSPSSDILHPNQRMRKEKNKGLVRRKERNPNWTKEEDEALCKAWLRVSDDPATWTDQPRTRLWDRVWAEYNSILGCETERRSSGLLNRWSIIQSHLNKYSGFVSTIDNTRTNGYDIEESIGAAKQLYYRSEGHHFKWDGCWLLLKDTTKWFNYVEERESKRQKMAQNKKGSFEVDLDQTADSPDPSASATTPYSNAGSVGLDDENSPLPEESHELPHSPGRELALNKTVDSSDPSTPATTPGSNSGSVSLDDESTPLAKESRELPQPPREKAVKNMRQLEDVQSFFAEFSKLRKEQKEIAEQEITMAKKREELKLQASKEEERRWVEAKLEPERMKITAKHEQGRMRLEKEIMMTDPNLVPTKEGKAWVIAQQKAILARMMQAGVGDGSRGSGV